MPPAPPTFSTITCCCKASLKADCRMRATASIGPPVANGTTIVSGRLGQVSALIGGATTASRAIRTSRNILASRGASPQLYVVQLIEILVSIAILPYLGISSPINFTYSSFRNGVLKIPNDCSLSRNVGSTLSFASSALKRSTTSLGRPAGPDNPNHRPPRTVG